MFHNSHSWFPPKTNNPSLLSERKSNQQKAPSVSEPWVEFNSFLTDSLLILAPGTDIPFSLIFSVCSKSNKISLGCSVWHGQHSHSFWFLCRLSKILLRFLIKVKMRGRHDLPKGHDIHSVQWLGQVLWRAKQSFISPFTCNLDKKTWKFLKKKWDFFLCALVKYQFQSVPWGLQYDLHSSYFCK